MNTKKIIKNAGNVLFIVLVSVVVSYFTLTTINKNKATEISKNNAGYSAPTSFAKFTNEQSFESDFTTAAEKTVNAVVHVKTKFAARTSTTVPIDPFFDFFFGNPEFHNRTPQPQMGSGSGVIISSEGYIVTNNHVIDRAEEIEITLNDKRTYIAKVIGTDPTTDIALLKIDAENLMPIVFGNSDNVKIGEWVLAVGNPFNLTSTVTAGIVSAKARNINILDADMKIESFIQTDAAINPGNSGGALVNIYGELIGINTAIASQTGSYAGYGFAVPSSIVSKVVADLKEFGTVQRALLGVNIVDITNEFAKAKNIKLLKGVYVAQVMENSAAGAAGIKEGDIITAVNNVKVMSVAELQEQIGRYRPGDKVNITLTRKEKEQNLSVELKNMHGNTDVIKKVNLNILGADFKVISSDLAQRLRLSNGMQVKSVTSKGKFDKAGITKDFIILRLNNLSINSISDIEKVVNDLQNSNDNEKGLFITGIYPDGKKTYYVIDLGEK
jgi:Do/DeqQ family serine protease